MIEEEILNKLDMYFSIFKSVDEKFNKEKTDVELCQKQLYAEVNYKNINV